jgi:hypothetical protein
MNGCLHVSTIKDFYTHYKKSSDFRRSKLLSTVFGVVVKNIVIFGGFFYHRKYLVIFNG